MLSIQAALFWKVAVTPIELLASITDISAALTMAKYMLIADYVPSCAYPAW